MKIPNIIHRALDAMPRHAFASAGCAAIFSLAMLGNSSAAQTDLYTQNFGSEGTANFNTSGFSFDYAFPQDGQNGGVNFWGWWGAGLINLNGSDLATNGKKWAAGHYVMNLTVVDPGDQWGDAPTLSMVSITANAVFSDSMTVLSNTGGYVTTANTAYTTSGGNPASTANYPYHQDGVGGTHAVSYILTFDVAAGNPLIDTYMGIKFDNGNHSGISSISLSFAATASTTATTTTLASSGSPSSYGTTVTLTATVVPAPTGGTVQFYDNAAVLGSPVTVDTGTGLAQLATSALSVGGHPITATYSGTTGISGSTASVITQTVNQATATITTAPTASSITYGQTLANSTLSGGVGSVAGSFAFTTPTTAPGVGSADQNVTFTPTNANYTTATTAVSVTVNKATPVYKAPVGAGELINVSIGSATKTSPAGPAGGAGATWNQFTWSGQWQSVTGSSLKNSANVTTTVGFDFTNQWSAFDPWGNPSQTLLKNGANPNGSQTGIITGLTPGAKYDVYIASYHGNDRNNGSFSTTNPTTNGSSQSLDSTATPNGSTWVEGQNYVAFMGTVADGSGIISLTWNPINHLAMMGFQLVAAGTPTPAATDIVYGQKLSASTLSGTFVDAAGATVAGVMAFTNPNEVPNVGTAPHSVTFTPTDTGNYNIGTTSVNVTVTAPTDSFGSWISTNYPGLSDKTAAGDPDGDGMTNQAEYAFGLDPSSGSSCNPIVKALDKTTGTFSYTRRVGTGYTYRVWTSIDLVSPWTEDTAAVQHIDSTVVDIETVTVTLSASKPLAATKLFMRVTAE